MTTPPPAFCHRCRQMTATVYLPLSSGHLGNCCAACHACRRGRPFVPRHQSLTTNAATGQRGNSEELSVNRS